MNICNVYPIENYNRGKGAMQILHVPWSPTYRGCTVNTKLLERIIHLTYSLKSNILT